MPGETILVVEDTPVSLKLSAVVLRGEGYKVHVASNAEQALITLNTVRPELMLVDIRLPGISGLDLTREVKNDPSHKGIIVIALTSLNTPADEERARDAGCDGYLTKPIDTRTLAESVRRFLDRGAPQLLGADLGPDSEPLAGLAFPDLLLDDLRLAFLSATAVESARLQTAPVTQIDPKRIAQFQTTAAVLGFPSVAALAREAAAIASDPAVTAGQTAVAFTKLSRAVDQSAAATPTETLPMPLLDRLAGKKIALIAVADAEAEILCAALGRAGAKPRLFDGSEPPSAEALCACAAALVHVRPDTLILPWFKPDFAPPQGMAVLYIAHRRHLLCLYPEVQARARDFLVDYWQPDEALLRIYLALARG
jgi:CheY-like chemotaxis protein